MDARLAVSAARGARSGPTSTTTYIALIGAVALGSALAFGLGGREAAADLINSGYRKAQEASSDVRADLAVGKERATADIRSRTGGEATPASADHPSEPAVGATNGHGTGH